MRMNFAFPCVSLLLPLRDDFLPERPLPDVVPWSVELDWLDIVLPDLRPPEPVVEPVVLLSCISELFLSLIVPDLLFIPGVVVDLFIVPDRLVDVVVPVCEADPFVPLPVPLPVGVV